MQSQLAVALLVIAVVGFALAAQVYARVKSDFDIDAAAEAREQADVTRWQGYVAKAVKLDATQPVNVPAGTLVLVQGRLEGAGALVDDAFHIARPGALSLQRKGWIAEKTASESTESYWDPVRRPSDTPLAGERDWWAGGKTRTRTTVTSFLRWFDAWPGSPRDQALAVRAKDAVYAESARIGSIPVSPVLFKSIPRTSTVPLDASALEVVPAASRALAELIDDDGFSGLQVGGAKPDGQRIALVEAPAGEVTILAGWNGEAIAPWKEPDTDNWVSEVAPGFVDASMFVPKVEPRLAPGESPMQRVFGDPARAALVVGGGVIGLAALGFAIRLLLAGRR